MVELKFSFAMILHDRLISLNRTMVELKSLYDDVQPRPIRSLNRTMVELKLNLNEILSGTGVIA